MLFGPAYKGIPLVTLTAAALAEHHGRDVPFCFNRKEAKDHGEGGLIVGAPMSGRVLIVDDVITAGTAIRESVDIITAGRRRRRSAYCSRSTAAKRAPARLSAVQEVEQQLRGCASTSIINLDDLVEHLEGNGEYSQFLPLVTEYRSRYGVTA